MKTKCCKTVPCWFKVSIYYHSVVVVIRYLSARDIQLINKSKLNQRIKSTMSIVHIQVVLMTLQTDTDWLIFDATLYAAGAFRGPR